MHRRRSSATAVLATGAITWAISERAFWGRLRPDDGVADGLATLTAYTAVAYLALLVARRERVRDARRLLLVGALLGWVVEGAIVATVYAELPLSIVWTALAWHAPLSVVVGWRVLPHALAAGGRRAATATAALGAALGAWSAFMATNAALRPSPADAAANAGLVVGVLAAGYAARARVQPGPEALRPGATGAVVAALVALWAALVVLPAVPVAPLVLGPLVALVLVALRRGRPAATEDAGAPAADVLAGVPGRRLLPLVVVPAVAAASCAAVAAAGLAAAVGPAAYVILSAGGVALLVRAVRAPRPPAPVPGVA